MVNNCNHKDDQSIAANYVFVAIAVFIAAFSIDLLLARLSGIPYSFVTAFVPKTFYYAVPTIGLALVAERHGYSRLAALLSGSILSGLVGFTILPMSYELHTFGRPLIDHTLQSADIAVGFHWETYVHWIIAHRYVQDALLFCYNSMPFQLMIATWAVALLRPTQDSYQFVAVAAVAGLIGTLVALAFPTIGMLECVDHKAFNPAHWSAATPRDIVMFMRHNRPDMIDFSKPVGMFNFPSFHTLSACVVIYAHRKTFLRIPAILTNVPIMAAAIPFGAHFLVDILAGIAVFYTAVGVVHAVDFIAMRTKTAFINFKYFSSSTTGNCETVELLAKLSADRTASVDNRLSVSVDRV